MSRFEKEGMVDWGLAQLRTAGLPDWKGAAAAAPAAAFLLTLRSLRALPRPPLCCSCRTLLCCGPASFLYTRPQSSPLVKEDA